MAANQNEVDVLKQSMTNWIKSLLQVLEMSEIENNTHLRTWIYGMLDARNAPFLGHTTWQLWFKKSWLFIWELHQTMRFMSPW